MPGTGWATGTETAQLTASDAADNDRFGSSVAIDGDTVVVGAQNNDTANVFDIDDWADIAGSNAATTSHIVTGLTNDIDHTFRVRALDSAEASDPSDSVAGTPKAAQIRPAGPTPTPVREQARTPGPRWPTATPTNVQIIDLAPHLPDEDKVDVVVKTSSGERYRYRIDPEVSPRSLLGEGDRVAKIVPPKSIMGNYPPRPTPKPPPPPKSTPSPPPNIPDLAQDTVSSEEREEVKARRGPPPWGPHTAGSVIQIAGHQLQLPSDVYVEAIVSEILCIAGEPCPVAPLYVLRRGDSLASIEKRTGRFAPGTPVSTMETFDFIEKALR